MNKLSLHDESILINIDKLLNDFCKQDIIFGANLSICLNGEVALFETYGYKDIYPKKNKNSINTIYDIASLTKIVATWIAIIKLCSENKIDLSTQLKDIDTKFSSSPLKNVTIQQLLTHTSGLSERTYLRNYGENYQEIINNLIYDNIEYHDSSIHYSNKGFIILGHLIEIISGMNLDEFCSVEIWKKAHMNTTFYQIPNEKLCDVAPTEIHDEKVPLVGIVHDENARFVQHALGHAGVFSNLKDLTIFCQQILSDNIITDNKLIKESFKNIINTPKEKRGLAWVNKQDTVYYHLGYTGTGIWLDVVNNKSMVLLTNRVHPNRQKYMEGIQIVRKRISDEFIKLESINI